jgi:hypothetical protein
VRGASVRGYQQTWDRRPIQVGIQDADRLAASSQRSGKMSRHIALAHASFAAHHRDDAAHPRQLLRHTAALSADLVGQAGTVRIGQLVIGAHKPEN